MIDQRPSGVATEDVEAGLTLDGGRGAAGDRQRPDEPDEGEVAADQAPAASRALNASAQALSRAAIALSASGSARTRAGASVAASPASRSERAKTARRRMGSSPGMKDRPDAGRP